MSHRNQLTDRLLLTAREAAQALAISQRKLWDLTARNEIPHLRLGRSVRYPMAELQLWIASQQQGEKQCSLDGTSGS